MTRQRDPPGREPLTSPQVPRVVLLAAAPVLGLVYVILLPVVGLATLTVLLTVTLGRVAATGALAVFAVVRGMVARVFATAAIGYEEDDQGTVLEDKAA